MGAKTGGGGGCGAAGSTHQRFERRLASESSPFESPGRLGVTSMMSPWSREKGERPEAGPDPKGEEPKALEELERKKVEVPFSRADLKRERMAFLRGRRSARMRSNRPTMSVSTPGVMRRTPATETARPSRRLS